MLNKCKITAKPILKDDLQPASLAPFKAGSANMGCEKKTSLDSLTIQGF